MPYSVALDKVSGVSRSFHRKMKAELGRWFSGPQFRSDVKVGRGSDICIPGNPTARWKRKQGTLGSLGDSQSVIPSGK